MCDGGAGTDRLGAPDRFSVASCRKFTSSGAGAAASFPFPFALTLSHHVPAVYRQQELLFLVPAPVGVDARAAHPLRRETRAVPRRLELAIVSQLLTDG